MNQRRFNALIALVLIAVAASFYWYEVSPWSALTSIRDAAVSNDSEELRQLIDFPRLRESLKDQLRAQLMTKVTAEQNGFAALGAMLGMSLAEKMVDSLVTPQWIAQSIQTGMKSGTNDDATPAWQLALRPPFAINRTGLSAFMMTKTDAQGHPITLRLERRGLSWVLVDIAVQFPTSN